MRLHRGLGLAMGMMVVLAGVTDRAEAQYGRRWGYPGGYRGYGWGGWGSGSIANDPASGLMAGLGSYARGMGAYEVSDAQARSINAQTILKWNDALRARKQALQAQKQQEDARKQADLQARAQQDAVESGATLNALMDRIFEFNPAGTRAYAANAEVSPDAIRDIPFEPATEAITLCLDEMTADDAWPAPLQDAPFDDERQAVREAVRRALEEDVKGEVSAQALKGIDDAVAALRAQFHKATGELDLVYADADEFTRSLAGLSRLLQNPKYKEVLAQLETYKGTTVGELMAFMQSFNLRFGPATTPRQVDIYRRLVPMFEGVLQAVNAGEAPPPVAAADDTTPSLPEAAREVFKGMTWQHLDAQARPEK